MDASIVITTRNRRKDALRAVESCLAQEKCRIEVLVFDDASDDGTVDEVRGMAPEVRVFVNEERMGYIPGRNRGFHEATAEIVFSLDDDAYFSTTDIVSRTLQIFRENPSVGAVAIPYIEPLNVRSLSSLRTPLRVQPGDSLRSYAGCAHAVRREVALALGGYREFFVHQGEERDLCLRMMDAGWRVLYGSSGLIVHMVSPKRESERVTYFGARNRILFNILNLPFSVLAIRSLWDPVAIIRYRFSWSSLLIKMRGIGSGFVEGIARIRERRPVSRATYRHFTHLPGHGPEHWDKEIPPRCRRAAAETRTIESSV